MCRSENRLHKFNGSGGRRSYRKRGIPMLGANSNQKVMAAGARRIGYREVSTGAMAINPVPRDGRPGSNHDGFCYQGIRSNAKWSALNAEIPKGEATGKLEVRSHPTLTIVALVIRQADYIAEQLTGLSI
jgi:hypothetical protein